jgi:hypothetical protein
MNSMLLISGGDYASDMTQSLVTMVLLANLPQLTISFLHITYNALTTCMILGKEWNMIGVKQKGLRVTNPQGMQCSSDFFFSSPTVRKLTQICFYPELISA